MIALDPLLWLRDALREHEDVKSADIERGGYIVLMLRDGTRIHASASDASGYVVPTFRE